MSSGNGNNGNRRAEHEMPVEVVAGTPIHPAWEVFIRYCQHLGHGELERLKIQDGIPVLAEVTIKKVKF